MRHKPSCLQDQSKPIDFYTNSRSKTEELILVQNQIFNYIKIQNHDAKQQDYHTHLIAEVRLLVLAETGGMPWIKLTETRTRSHCLSDKPAVEYF